MIMGGNKKTLCAHHGRNINNFFLKYGRSKRILVILRSGNSKKKNNYHKQDKTRISILHLSRTYEKDTLSETEKARGKLHSKMGVQKKRRAHY